MKRAMLFLTFVLMSIAVGADKPDIFAAFSESDMQHNKQIALRAINSPEVWRRFPKNEHQRHYTPLTGEISFGFSTTRTGYQTMTIIIPTTHFGPRHRTLIYVRLTGRGDILDMEEVPQI
jgi:hypothetical protein